MLVPDVCTTQNVKVCFLFSQRPTVKKKLKRLETKKPVRDGNARRTRIASWPNVKRPKSNARGSGYGTRSGDGCQKNRKQRTRGRWRDSASESPSRATRRTWKKTAAAAMVMVCLLVLQGSFQFLPTVVLK